MTGKDRVGLEKMVKSKI